MHRDLLERGVMADDDVLLIPNSNKNESARIS